jgi:hypothetical protein
MHAESRLPIDDVNSVSALNPPAECTLTILHLQAPSGPTSTGYPGSAGCPETRLQPQRLPTLLCTFVLPCRHHHAQQA